MVRVSPADRPGFGDLVACYLAYMAAAGFGRWLMVIPEIPITVWPPNGVILAFMLANRPAWWPWWLAMAAAGELTANAIWFGNPFLPALGYVGANAAEVLTGAVLLAPRLRAPEARFQSLGQVFAFLALGVLAAPAIGATIGSTIDAAVGKNSFLTTWPLWWLGDATGVLIATPLVMSGLNALRERARPTLAQILEGAAISVTLAALGAWLQATGFPYPFILFVPLLWAALRFEMRGATLVILAVAAIIGLQGAGSEPWLRPVESASYRHAMLQVFVLVAASTGLIVAAIIRQYRHALGALAAANAELEQRVAARTGEIVAAERRFKATFENAAVGMAIVDAGGRLLRVNGSLAQMLGRTAGDLEGRHLDEFTHPDDVPASTLAWERLTSGAADQYVLDKRYVGKDGEAVWGHTAVSCIRLPDQRIDYGVKVIQDVTARHRSDEARQLLMYEVNHRSKNLLAMVQAIARQTVASSPKSFLERFGQRLQAMSASQDLLVASGWEPVLLDDLVRAQLAHFGEVLEQRFTIEGPPVLVSARVAQAIGMALHELGTNATKYGSLGNETGRVAIVWEIADDGFSMSWTETGGPPVEHPTRRGFGSTVIDTLVGSSLLGDVTVDFRASGLVWTIRCSTGALREETPDARKAPERVPQAVDARADHAVGRVNT